MKSQLDMLWNNTPSVRKYYLPYQILTEEVLYMKATGIVRRIDDLGRVVIPKEIRRTMRIREGDPLLTTLTPKERAVFYIGWVERKLEN